MPRQLLQCLMNNRNVLVNYLAFNMCPEVQYVFIFTQNISEEYRYISLEYGIDPKY